ncbi:MAG: hypothetical protein ACRY3E_00460 [Candidatus Lariskella arthropodorum]
MNWSIYPTFASFLVQPGPTTVSQLDELHGADLRVALEGASPLQREMMLAAIQFHLRTPSADGESYLSAVDGVYTTRDESIVEERAIEEQRATFEALQLTGVTFEEVIAAPRLILNTSGSTMCNIFHHALLDALFLGRMFSIYDTAHEARNYLLSSVTNTGWCYLPQQARAFLATVLLNEPELILNIRHERRGDSNHIFQEITQEHITAALNTVVQDPWAAVYFLTHIEQIQNTARNINASVIAGILNAQNDQHIMQAFHTIMQDPQTMSFLSQNLDVVAFMLFREYMNAEGLRDAIHHEAITHTIGINDIALELAIEIVRAHNSRLITDPLHIGAMGGEVLHNDMAELIFNHLNAHEILQVIRAEEEYFDARDQFDFEQQEQDAQITLAMDLPPEPNFFSMDILLSS